MEYYYAAWTMYLLGIWITVIGWTRTHKYCCKYPKLLNVIGFIFWPVITLAHFTICALIAFLILLKKAFKGV